MSDVDLPDPDEWVVENITDMDELGEGVARDVLVEAMIQSDHDVQQARRIRVDLDGMADNLGRYPDEVTRRMRDLQRQADELALWLEEYHQAVQHRFADASRNEEDDD